MATYMNLTNVQADVPPPQPLPAADDSRRDWINVPVHKFLDFHVARSLGIDTSNRDYMDALLSWCLQWRVYDVARAISHQVVQTPYHEYSIAESLAFVSSENLAFLGPGQSMTLVQWLRERDFGELDHPEWPLVQLYNQECWPLELLRMANL